MAPIWTYATRIRAPLISRVLFACCCLGTAVDETTLLYTATSWPSMDISFLRSWRNVASWDYFSLHSQKVDDTPVISLGCHTADKRERKRLQAPKAARNPGYLARCAQGNGIPMACGWRYRAVSCDDQSSTSFYRFAVTESQYCKLVASILSSHPPSASAALDSAKTSAFRKIREFAANVRSVTGQGLQVHPRRCLPNRALYRSAQRETTEAAH